jgi:Integrase zinc binding domain
MLLSYHYKFYCDHKNLGFDNFKSERVRFWSAILQEFDYSFTYCPGKDNTFADMLSYYPITTVDTSTYKEITTLEDNLFPATTLNIKSSQNTIPDLHNKVLFNPNMYSIIHHHGTDIICRNGKIVVDHTLFSDILAWYHSNLNLPGQDHTYHTINSVFYTPNMEATVQKYVDNCQICKKFL